MIAAAVIVSRVLEFYWQSTPSQSLFICAVMISAWCAALGGLARGHAFLLAFDYYFLPPFYSFGADGAQCAPDFYGGAALMVALLAASQRAGLNPSAGRG